jgi:CHASE2 domain-containing sensor protein/tRNA A-37 threonylcarbamoyl transferase component Bud32
VYVFNPLRFIDNLFYDLNFTFLSSSPVDSVVIVGIDRQSIKSQGALPWPRTTMANIIRQIASAGPKVIALDFQFPRRDDHGESDTLASVLSSLDNVVLPFSVDGISTDSPHDKILTPNPLLLRHSFQTFNNEDQLDQTLFYIASGIDLPDSLFFNQTRYSGFLNMSTSNSSQKLREVIHVIRVGEYYVPSFAIATAAAFYNVPVSKVILDGKGCLTIGPTQIPVSSYAASVMLHFRSEKYPIPEYSASEILAGNFDKKIFENKVVFFGVTDPLAAADFFTTPLRSQFPGVAVWATSVLDILHGTWIKTDGVFSGILHFLFTLLIFPGLAIILPSKNRRISLFISIVLMITGIAGSIVLFKFANCFLSPAPPLYAWLCSLIWLAALRVDPSLSGASALQLEPSSNSGDMLAPPTLSTATPLESLQCETLDHVVLKTGLLNNSTSTTSDPSFTKTIDEQRISLQTSVLETKDITKVLECAGGQIIKLLGSGGMADVYLIWHPRLEAYRAVKVMKPHLSENFLSRFETEIRIFSKLDHPNIVRCFGVGDWHSLPYIEMEYINGSSFESVLQKCKILSVEQALIAGVLVCRALEYAHSRTMHIYGKEIQGIIHRDLKPANIMITTNGRIKLTDFGIARPQELSLHTTETENIAGTLPYIAPEIFDRNEYLPRSDIYALGATLYEFISGERTFPQSTVTTMLNAKTSGKYKPLSTVAKIPGTVETIIDRSLHVDPLKRYQSVRELRIDLEKSLQSICGNDTFKHISALIKRIYAT